MFWSLTVKPGETVSQTCFMDLAVTNATLGDGNKNGNKVLLKVHYPISMTDDGKMVYEEAVLCALTAGVQENALLNAHFDEDDEVRFSVSGKAPVYLTGNFIEPNFDGEDEDDEELTEEQYNALSPEDRAELERLIAQEGSNEDSEDSEEESDEEGMDDEDDEESSSDEEAARQAAAKIGSKRPLEKAKTPDPKRTKKDVKTPAKDAKKEPKTPAKKESKTPAKKEPKTPAKKEPKTPAKDAKKDAKTPAKKEPKTPAKKEEKSTKRPDTPNVKTISGGLQIVDLATGSGKPARNGSTVTVQYIGRLATGNKKVFDKSKKFSFRLGEGEVIKGWDLGIEGMKTGGKRKLLIPAKLAYGASGAPPDIPPNAKLEFDVILSKC